MLDVAVRGSVHLRQLDRLGKARNDVLFAGDELTLVDDRRVG
jgi:hypothetical protein